MEDEKPPQRVTLLWDGQTLDFGLFPENVATAKSSLIKMLAARWKKVDPKPSKEWVESQIRRRFNLHRTPTVTINDDVEFQITPKLITENRGLISGKWIRDKRIAFPLTSLRAHYEAMGIPIDSLESHVKKDESMDTICEMHLTSDYFKIRAFYIQDDESQPQAMGFPIGKEVVERSGAKRTLVTSSHPTKVVMKRSMITASGYIELCDTKEVVLCKDVELPDGYTERPNNILKQTVIVENHKLGRKHTLMRYYLPFEA